MREIKSRAFYKKSQTWVYFTVGSILTDDGLKIYHELCLNGARFYQYTGLKDKNNVEIYEGDILAIKFNPHYVDRVSWKGEPDAIATVIWDFSGFRLKAKGSQDTRFADFWNMVNQETYCYTMVDINLEHTEVIGNIYQNPELLGKDL